MQKVIRNRLKSLNTQIMIIAGDINNKGATKRTIAGCLASKILFI